jgi:hypothetical protein
MLFGSHIVAGSHHSESTSFYVCIQDFICAGAYTGSDVSAGAQLLITHDLRMASLRVNCDATASHAVSNQRAIFSHDNVQRKTEAPCRLADSKILAALFLVAGGMLCQEVMG